MSTFERLMPSTILSKAASTPVEGAAGVGLALGRCDAAVVPVDFGFGVGEGFGSTVRVRVVVVEEFEFCANANVALTSTIEAMTRNLFNMISSSCETFVTFPIHSTEVFSADALPNVRGQLSQRLQTLTVTRPVRSTWCAQH
jgi:hypothetical protein